MHELTVAQYDVGSACGSLNVDCRLAGWILSSETGIDCEVWYLLVVNVKGF